MDSRTTALCESEGIGIEPSPDASYLLTKVTLADEIRMVLRALYPLWLRSQEVRNHLARLGHDMTKYSNPQAAVIMVMKRMHDSREIEETVSPEGKRSYRCANVPPATKARWRDKK
jgi:hypothetical protein